MKFGIDLNVERAKKGLVPIDSISKIYFMHYKPYLDANPKKKSEQPAGADAPVSGATQTPNLPAKTDGYVYKRDHKRSFRQILTEGMNRNKS